MFAPPTNQKHVSLDQTPRLVQNHYFFNSEILGMHIWREKKSVSFDKFEIARNCVNEIFNRNAFFCFLLTGAT